MKISIYDMIIFNIFSINIRSNKSLSFFKGKTWGFPGDPVMKNSPASAEDTGSIPGPGTKIPLATKQLSPWALQ